MEKEIIAAADFQRKPYAAPRANTVHVDPAGIVCQSQVGRSNESYEECDTDDWFNN